MAEILIIADLHLSAGNTAALAPLRALLPRAAKAEALYILGDLFDYWVGDDQPVPPAVADVLNALAALPCRRFFQSGNRDFLIGHEFLTRLGATALPDELLMETGAQPVLLCHGDQLCTDDLAYQAMRQQLRSPAFRCDFLGKPLAERTAVAEALRARSKTESSRKPEDIMDVNAEAVQRLMAAHPARVLVHGHTHRPAIHRLDNGALRVVTGDWGETGWLVALDEHGVRLENFDAERSTVIDQASWPAPTRSPAPLPTPSHQDTPQ